VIFTDSKTGREVEFVSSTASNPPGFRVGEQVAVLYDPEGPETAVIPGFFSLWIWVSILSSMGIIFVAAGGGLLLAPGTSSRGSTAPTFTHTSSGEDSKNSEISTASDFGEAHSADFNISNADADFSSV
jgi:hypothetical protein